MDTPDLYYGNQREALITAYAQCDSLIHRDPQTNEYQPLLATSWEWVDDKTLEMDLREGVKFHDGTDFDAQDVADTLNHVAAPDSDMKIRVIVDWIDNVEVVDDHNVRIHAKAPTPAAFEYLSGTSPIYPAGHYDSAPEVPGADGTTRRDWGAVNPVCTGPYKLTDYQAGQSLTLEAQPGLFRGQPEGQAVDRQDHLPDHQGPGDPDRRGRHRRRRLDLGRAARECRHAQRHGQPDRRLGADHADVVPGARRRGPYRRDADDGRARASGHRPCHRP